MPNNPLYDGIIAPQGGLYRPGPPVMLPPQGLGALPQMDKVDTSSPLQYGMLQDQFGLNSAPSQAPHFGTIPGPNGYTVADKDQSQLAPGQAGNLFAYGGSAPSAPAPGIAAIGAALSNGGSGSGAWGPSFDIGINPDLAWQSSGSPPAPGGDTWLGLRSPTENIYGVSPNAGAVTGSRGLKALPAASQPVYRSKPITYGTGASNNSNDYKGMNTPLGALSNSVSYGTQLPDSVVNSSRWSTGY